MKNISNTSLVLIPIMALAGASLPLSPKTFDLDHPLFLNGRVFNAQQWSWCPSDTAIISLRSDDVYVKYTPK